MAKDEAYYEKMRDYKDGVWSYMLEHCRVLPTGKMRVIFDIDTQDNFEKRVWARYKHVYHRGNPVQKQKMIQEKRGAFIEGKEEKKKRWEDDKKQRRAMQAEIKREVARLTLLNRYPKWQIILIEVYDIIFKKNEPKNTGKRNS